MKKLNKKTLYSTTLLTLLPIIIGLLLWDKLPDVLPIHFDFRGNTDGFMSKNIVIFAFPFLFMLLNLLVIFLISNDPKRENIGNKVFSISCWIIPIIDNLVIYSIYAIALNYQINVILLTHLIIGLVFISIGNYMTKNHQNYTIGIRLPWTLDNQNNWNKTHRFASKIWILSGLLIILNGFIKIQYLSVTLIGLAIVLPIIYSFVLYKSR